MAHCAYAQEVAGTASLERARRARLTSQREFARDGREMPRQIVSFMKHRRKAGKAISTNREASKFLQAGGDETA